MKEGSGDIMEKRGSMTRRGKLLAFLSLTVSSLQFSFSFHQSIIYVILVKYRQLDTFAYARLGQGWGKVGARLGKV